MDSDLLILWLVIGLRFFVPLLIPRYPLPAVVACLIIDGIDQTIFQTFTTLSLEGYQGYDKALDIYYLTVAYISTLKNWEYLLAYEVSRFLFYWRLFGVVAFELTQLRALLMVFPNTFEYFFIFYEVVRSRWNPLRMTRNFVVGAAAFIWIFIKLPQEWWIHIAQLDTTDLIKELLGGTPDSAWGDLISANLWIFPALAVVIVLIWWLARRLARRLPSADHELQFEAPPALDAAQTEAAARGRPLLDRHLVEKVAMVSLVSIIFAQVLPGVEVSGVRLSIAVAYVIVVNTVISAWFARRGLSWSTAVRQFAVMFAVNAASLWVYQFWFQARTGAGFQRAPTLFFLLLLTMLVVLYDRMVPTYWARREVERGAGEGTAAGGS